MPAELWVSEAALFRVCMVHEILGTGEVNGLGVG